MHHNAVSDPSATEATDRPDKAPAARPLGLIPLALSLFGIAGVAILLCCILAVIVVLATVADVGREGASEIVEELKFDSPLKTQIGALVVSALYIGVAGATVAAAIGRGRRGWSALVALSPVRRWTEVAVIGLATLAYAGIATFLVERMHDHRLLTMGPTDLVLLGTFVTNLVVLAPLAEELLFRGWLYTGLRRRLPFWPSFLVTVVLFATIHGEQNPGRILQVLPLAVALGLLRERAGSIKPTIALHGAYNLMIVAIRLAFS